MPEKSQPIFLVDAYSDPALIRIQGRASFMNCTPLRDFFNRMIGDGKTHFILDFVHCTGMDSTFLGILAGVALQAKKTDPPGSLTLCRLGPRNLELVRNLGLHRILTIDTGAQEKKASREMPGEALEGKAPSSEVENARLVLQAHENLVEADQRNIHKFQDVISFLKNQVERD